FYHFLHPFIGTLILSTEIAVANAKSLSKRIISCDFIIKYFYLLDQSVECLVVKCHLICPEVVRIKSRFHLKKTESTAQSIVDHSQYSISSIHHPNDVQIIRNAKRHPVIGERCLCAPVIFFK